VHIGEHNADVYGRIVGYGPEKVAELKAQGVI